jgi:hypothetical protein
MLGLSSVTGQVAFHVGGEQLNDGAEVQHLVSAIDRSVVSASVPEEFPALGGSD